MCYRKGEYCFEIYYFSQDQIISFSNQLNSKFSVLQLNIRSIHKNIGKLRDFLGTLKGNFSVIVLTETWCTDDNANKNSLLQIPNYTPIHQRRKTNRKGGGVSMFIHNKFNFQLLNNLNKSNDDIETLSIEILNKITKNIIISGIYRPPNGNSSVFKSEVKDLIQKVQKSKQIDKPFYTTGDLNINSLDYSENATVRNFFNLAFQSGLIPVINRPTRVTRTSATAIDHILTNTVLNGEIQSGIIKTDISDHMPVFSLMETKGDNRYDKTTIIKCKIKITTINNFKSLLRNFNWGDVIKNISPNESYNIFIERFSQIYEEAFPEMKTEVKNKTLLSPWVTKGLIKSSKRKQGLYEKFLKKRTFQNEQTYKTYKNLYEKIKKNSMELYYQNQLAKYQKDIKNTWKVMKEIIGKTKVCNDNFPKRLVIDKTEITNKKSIAETFNEYFVNVGPSLASVIPKSNVHFTSNLPATYTIFEETNLTEQEFKDAYTSLKGNRSPGFDDINVNVVKCVYDEIKQPLMHVFNQSLKYGVFPEKMKIARVTPIFKTGEKYSISNYRPISVLPCFSKILEKIMYNRLYSYLTENNLLYEKQFGFRAGHSTEHALADLVDQICESFNNNKYLLGIFIDLSKPF